MRILELDAGFSPAHYNMACLLAPEGDTAQALQFLTKAIEQNLIWRDFAKGDPDFAMLWQDQSWIELLYS